MSPENPVKVQTPVIKVEKEDESWQQDSESNHAAVQPLAPTSTLIRTTVTLKILSQQRCTTTLQPSGT